MKNWPSVQNLVGLLLFAGSIALILLLFLWPRQENQPVIVDVQVHYNQDAWRRYQPRAIINTLKELGVVSIVVSSIPNDGTFRLQAEGPLRVIPFLSLYRKREDRDTWFQDPTIPGYIEEELQYRRYRGIGEFHLLDGQVDTPVVRRMLELAVENNLILLAHSDTQAIKQLYTIEPGLKIIWAHAGMTTSPLVIKGMLYKYPTLWVELSHRIDIARRGKLDPRWRELFLDYPDRFMIGSGTYTNEDWYQFRYTINNARRWLRQLPPDVAELIAHKNATRLLAH